MRCTQLVPEFACTCPGHNAFRGWRKLQPKACLFVAFEIMFRICRSSYRVRILVMWDPLLALDAKLRCHTTAVLLQSSSHGGHADAEPGCGLLSFGCGPGNECNIFCFCTACRHPAKSPPTANLMFDVRRQVQPGRPPANQSSPVYTTRTESYKGIVQGQASHAALLLTLKWQGSFVPVEL